MNSASYSFWVSGTGALPERTQPVLSSIDPLLIASDLRNAAIAHDWADWIQAWRMLDTTQCAALLREVEAGNYARLTLCGERHAMTLDTRKTGFFDRIKRRFGHQPLYSLCDKL